MNLLTTFISYIAIQPERPFTTMCAWCMRTRDDANQWQPAGQALRLSNAHLTHTICPDCLNQYRRDLAQLDELIG